MRFEDSVQLFAEEKQKAMQRMQSKILSSNMETTVLKRNNKTVVSCEKMGFKVTIESPYHTKEMIESMIIDLIEQYAR